MPPTDADRLLGMFHDTVRDFVGSGRDLTLRQLAVLFITYGPAPDPTVRRLAGELGIPKPSVSRALDTLSKRRLLRRAEDPTDHRSVVVHGTAEGRQLLRDVGRKIKGAGAEEERTATAPG